MIEATLRNSSPRSGYRGIGVGGVLNRRYQMTYKFIAPSAPAFRSENLVNLRRVDQGGSDGNQEGEYMSFLSMLAAALDRAKKA